MGSQRLPNILTNFDLEKKIYWAKEWLCCKQINFVEDMYFCLSSKRTFMYLY